METPDKTSICCFSHRVYMRSMRTFRQVSTNHRALESSRSSSGSLCFTRVKLHWARREGHRLGLAGPDRPVWREPVHGSFHMDAFENIVPRQIVWNKIRRNVPSYTVLSHGSAIRANCTVNCT